MTAGARESARSVDPATRRMAEDLARHSGLSLREWVSRLMSEGMEAPASEGYRGRDADWPPNDEPTRVTVALERLSERIETAETRQALAIAGVERSVREVIGRIDAAEREQMHAGAKFERALQDLQDGRQGIVGRLEGVEREQLHIGTRLESALQSVKAAAGGLAPRFETLEREQVKLGARLESAYQETRTETLGQAERLRQLAAEDPAAQAKLEALQLAVGKVAGQLFDSDEKARETVGELTARIDRVTAAEQANLAAMRELKNTCMALDARIGFAERGAEEGVERVAQDFSARIEAAREALSHELAAAAEARFGKVDEALAQMSGHVRTAEQRSHGALERMGHEVVEMAHALNRRMQSVERHGEESAGRTGAELSRIASAVEDRMARADSVQAQALEKLGGEIARITERLADRIANSERRSAQAIDDVGEQVARVTERITERAERATGELIDRIRLSEERTARLLEEARQKIDDRLAETHRRLAEAQRAADQARREEADRGPFGGGPFSGLDEIPAERPLAETGFDRRGESLVAETFEPPAPFMSAEPPPPQARAPAAAPEPDAEPLELEPNVGFDLDEPVLGPLLGPALAPPAEEPPSESLDAPSAAAPAVAGLSTREVIERARAAARAASESGGSARFKAASRPSDDTILQALSFQRARARPGGATGALVVAGVLAAVGLSAGGYVFLEGKPMGKTPKRIADSLALAAPDAKAAPDGAGEPLAAVAVDPTQSVDPSADHALAGLYSEAVAKVSAGAGGGLADMQKLAERGYAPAQFYLAELYQDGKSGLARDAVLSRRWLEKAADGGDRTAMHNLALDYHDGVGGPKNGAQAAEWFRRAADLGLVDSQYNLAALYEHGDGVAANPAEAYKWYLIASRSGDAGARAGALRVREALSLDAREVAEQSAAAFAPAAPASVAAVAPAAAVSPDMVTAQRALSQLGYYEGPADGSSSPALRLALAAYQRDQSLAVTGAPDPATIAKLSAYTR